MQERGEASGGIGHGSGAGGSALARTAAAVSGHRHGMALWPLPGEYCAAPTRGGVPDLWGHRLRRSRGDRLLSRVWHDVCDLSGLDDPSAGAASGAVEARDRHVRRKRTTATPAHPWCRGHPPRWPGARVSLTVRGQGPEGSTPRACFGPQRSDFLRPRACASTRVTRAAALNMDRPQQDLVTLKPCLTQALPLARVLARVADRRSGPPPPASPAGVDHQPPCPLGR
jgi:hypothetical protein